MKKIGILFLSVIALGTTLTSCSKDDAKPSVVAKWTYSTYTYSKAGTTTPETPVNAASCTDKNYMDLRNAGALELQVVATDCTPTKSTGTYTYQNNSIHMVTPDGASDLTVVSLASTKMVVKNINPNDATEYYTITLIK